MTVFGAVEAMVNVPKPLAGLCTRLPFKVLQYSWIKLGLSEKKPLIYRATRIAGCREKGFEPLSSDYENGLLNVADGFEMKNSKVLFPK